MHPNKQFFGCGSYVVDVCMSCFVSQVLVFPPDGQGNRHCGDVPLGVWGYRRTQQGSAQGDGCSGDAPRFNGIAVQGTMMLKGTLVFLVAVTEGQTVCYDKKDVLWEAFCLVCGAQGPVERLARKAVV